MPRRSSWHQQEIPAQREELLVLRQENEQMRQQLTALATELASLWERISRKRSGQPGPSLPWVGVAAGGALRERP